MGWANQGMPGMGWARGEGDILQSVTMLEHSAIRVGPGWGGLIRVCPGWGGLGVRGILMNVLTAIEDIM